jgi:hypothetical protein
MGVDAGQISEAGERMISNLQFMTQKAIHATWHQRYPVSWGQISIASIGVERVGGGTLWGQDRHRLAGSSQGRGSDLAHEARTNMIS